MNRIAFRANITILIAVLLLAGLGFFLAEYAMESEQWVMSAGSPHVYNGSVNINTGVVTDRDNVILLDMRDERTYSNIHAIRASTIHWVGDRDGNIVAPALSTYAVNIVGYDGFNGLYSFGNSGGAAKLTLDAAVQTAALEALGSYKGTVGVYNYKTGELICAVSTPTFDPDNPPEITQENEDIYDSIYYNRFTQSAYTPGSIFKIATLAAALETMPDVEKKTFGCTGEYAIGQKTVICDGVHGNQDLKTAFHNSCNCAFAQLAEELGGDTLAQYVEQFGLTDSISFDGITTSAGSYSIADEDDNGNAYEVAWSGIGQYLDQVNPCGFMTFVGAIANGGKVVYPHVVKQITNGDQVTYDAKRQVGRQIMSKETAEKVAAYMNFNVTNRYGTENFAGLSAGAKTGTGEVGGGKKPNAMLTGFVLDERYPLAFMIAVEDAGYGRAVCVPIASKVLTACKDALN